MQDTVDPRRFESGDEARRARLVANERRLRRMNSRIEELNRVAPIVEGDAELHEGAERSVPAPGHELDVDRILGRREGLVVVCRI